MAVGRLGLLSLALIVSGAATAAQDAQRSCRTDRVSVGPGGVEGTFLSARPSLSADGRHLAFWTNASNLAPGGRGILVHDRATGTNRLVSVDSWGTPANSNAYEPAIAGDGSRVAFSSSADNLVPGDTNDWHDVFVHTLESGVTVRVNVSSGGDQANDASEWPSLSGDGRFVAFASLADNLVADDTNTIWDVFVHDLKSGATTRVSVDSLGGQAEGWSSAPSISADGRWVAFESSASDLVEGDTNFDRDVFVRDRESGVTERVSVATGGLQAHGDSIFPSISGDGRFVAFLSSADDLVLGDTNGLQDVFVRDRRRGTTTRVSVSSAGDQADRGPGPIQICGDGQRVAFYSIATNLVPGDLNGWGDVFVHDLRTRTTVRVSVDSLGRPGSLGAGWPSICADGTIVAFDSESGDLVPGDHNGVADVFVRACPAPARPATNAVGRQERD